MDADKIGLAGDPRPRVLALEAVPRDPDEARKAMISSHILALARSPLVIMAGSVESIS